MKKVIIILLSVMFIIIFNKSIIKNITLISLEKWFEKKITIKSIDINYSKNELIINKFKIKNNNNFLSKNIFQADKIRVLYKFNSFFTTLIIIENVEILNPILNVDLKIKNIDNKSLEDNLGLSKKLLSRDNPKIYSKKLIDINFLILETKIKNFRTNILTPESKNISIISTDMTFRKYGNEKGFQHYKDVFKIILSDLFLRIPDNKLKKLIKVNYNL